ncbi:MAG: ComEC/Rec2 family competence protein [Acidobacteria bacterium]|nr:ComEC/Rec2 family competence protein [Acidobacteriota bacterium]
MPDTPTVPHRPSFNPQPLALLAVSFAAGILLARLTAPPLFFSLLSSALGTLLALAAFKRRRPALATLIVLLAFASLGAAFAGVEGRGVGNERVRRLYEEGRVASGDPVEITGVVERAPEFAPDGFYLALGVERLRARGAEHTTAAGVVELFAPVRDAGQRDGYAELELRRGARVRVLVMLERAEEFRNPGGGSLTEFLDRRGVDARGTIKSPLVVERLDDERVPLPLVWLEAWREVLRGRMSELFSAETAGVLQAALLGHRHGLSRASAERFREGGTFHVLVISGLHISFIGGLVLLLMRRVTGRRALQFVVPCAVLWLYAVAVGAESSVVRAALMFTVVALAPVAGRRGATLNALGGAALVLLAYRPAELFDPSFQLTFLSVLGIVALGWPLVERLRAVGCWRPTRATPRPPACPRWFRVLGETLFWSERAWRCELARNVYSYRLFKTGAGVELERWRAQALVRYAFGAVVVSASVQLMLLPLFVVYFHRLSLVSVLLNIFVGVLMAAVSLGALAAMMLASVSASAAWPLVWLVERMNWLMTHSVDPFARAGMASLRLPEYTGHAAAIYVLYYAPLAVLLVSLARWQPLQTAASPPDGARSAPRRRARRLAWAGATLCLSLVVLHPFSEGRADGRLRLDLLDVGQGDAALLTFPNGATLLVDAGGRAEFRPRAGEVEGAPPARFERDARGIGEAVVSEYLWWRGRARVDYILATHAHADHMNGLNDIAHNFKVRAAFLGRADGGEAELARLAETLRRESVPIELVGRGDRLKFGAATVDVLWPPRAGEATQALSANDDSLVLRVRYGARVFLLTGDIERDAEAALVAARDDLRSDVVKVAHHGSRTSSTQSFVAAVRPSVAVVSVGLSSPFGHPDKRVVERWRAGGAQVLQTGRSGTITVSTDGQDLRVETFVRE